MKCRKSTVIIEFPCTLQCFKSVHHFTYFPKIIFAISYYYGAIERDFNAINIYVAPLRKHKTTKINITRVATLFLLQLFFEVNEFSSKGAFE